MESGVKYGLFQPAGFIFNAERPPDRVNDIDVTTANQKFSPLWYDRETNTMKVLNQLLLPQKTEYIDVNGVEDAFNVIKKMQVRGAPLIATVAIMGLAVECAHSDWTQMSAEDVISLIIRKITQYLIAARPTAVNLSHTMNKLKSSLLALKAKGSTGPAEQIRKWIISEALRHYDDEFTENRKLLWYSTKCVLANFPDDHKLTVMTVCNTGSLATVTSGTALGVIRELHTRNRLNMVFALETRPYLQGSRLTCYELDVEAIPHKLICDNMAAWAMQKKHIDLILAGADRIAANGDTANKVGTYMLAITAAFHRIPFYIVAPLSTIDIRMKNADCIPIEERPNEELLNIGGLPIAPPGTECWNPAFDITPGSLITGILTDVGCFRPAEMEESIRKIVGLSADAPT